MTKSKVYFTREITPESLVKIYQAAGKKLPGKVAVKLHSGEAGNQNFLKPEFYRAIMKEVKGTMVECNTAYEGERNTVEAHKELLKKHGWTEAFPVDLMDEKGELALPVKNGKYLKVDYVGKNLANYDSVLVLSHFKGHPMGGFGGALKNISIGIASSHGKAVIHGAGDPEKIWTADHDAFLESMAEAAQAVVNYEKGEMVFINTMANLSVDCDCCAVAEDPCMKDIGILGSTDPVAVDQACLDLIYAAVDDPGRAHLIERIESRNGVRIIERATELGVGNRDYELIEI